MSKLDGEASKPGSIGTPIDGVEMCCVDEDGNEVPQGEIGEILIRGHNIMKGYWDRPDATAEAIGSVKPKKVGLTVCECCVERARRTLMKGSSESSCRTFLFPWNWQSVTASATAF